MSKTTLLDLGTSTDSSVAVVHHAIYQVLFWCSIYKRLLMLRFKGHGKTQEPVLIERGAAWTNAAETYRLHPACRCRYRCGCRCICPAVRTCWLHRVSPVSIRLRRPKSKQHQYLVHGYRSRSDKPMNSHPS